jgi:CDP-diglyceride synthetase
MIIAAALVITFSIAGILQTLWLRSKLFKRLAFPIDLGLTLLNKRIFGDNKTVAGFLGMIVSSALSFSICGPWLVLMQSGALNSAKGSKIFVALTSPSPNTETWFTIGAIAGLIYMIGELPNSFLKRRFSIPPGELPKSKIARALCVCVDQTDSVFAASLFFYFLFDLEPLFLVFSCFFGALAHWAFNILLFKLRMKTAPL